ncbi:hypothetical protein [Pantanalinema sp. GBBB05]|uniref:hypothetical protein n=1 Tax=Pantanalinema sp. GBBB05 TaxID=2604139 RepID=UPI001D3E7108|nr:hypothetical protein [Pantanalinema sp. GBBB05]
MQLIIFTVYLLCIAYFLYRIINAFNDEYRIRLDEEMLKKQLEALSLQEILGVSFKFEKRYEFDKLKQLVINISNKSKSHSIYVDWDYCALTDFEGRSRRVTRLMPGSTLDLFQEQVFSPIAPNTTLKETITAEDVLKRRDSDPKLPVALELQVTKVLVDIKALNNPKGPDTNKRRYARFMQQKQDLEFFLELALRLVGPVRSLGGDRAHLLCRFVLTKLPWTAGLPWNPK